MYSIILLIRWNLSIQWTPQVANWITWSLVGRHLSNWIFESWGSFLLFLAVCLGSFSCCRMNTSLRPILKPVTFKFSFVISVYLCAFMAVFIDTKAPIWYVMRNSFIPALLKLSPFPFCLDKFDTISAVYTKMYTK